MGGMDHLDAVQAQLDELKQLLLGEKISRMCEEGESAGLGDEAKRLGGRKLEFRFVRGSTRTDETRERLLERIDEASVDQRVGDVRPAYGANSCLLEDRVDFQRHIDAVQLPHHSFGPLEPFFAEEGEIIQETLVGVIKEVREDVEILLSEGDTELESGDDGNAKRPAGLDGFIKRPDMIVIGNGNGGKPGPSCLLHKLQRCEDTVGIRGVHVQVRSSSFRPQGRKEIMACLAVS